MDLSTEYKVILLTSEGRKMRCKGTRKQKPGSTVVIYGMAEAVPCYKAQFSCVG